MTLNAKLLNNWWTKKEHLKRNLHKILSTCETRYYWLRQQRGEFVQPTLTNLELCFTGVELRCRKVRSTYFVNSVSYKWTQTLNCSFCGHKIANKRLHQQRHLERERERERKKAHMKPIDAIDENGIQHNDEMRYDTTTVIVHNQTIHHLSNHTTQGAKYTIWS